MHPVLHAHHRLRNSAVHLDQINLLIFNEAPRKEESCLRKVVDNPSIIPFDLIWDRTIIDFYIPELDPEKKPKISGLQLMQTKMSYNRPG